MVRFVTHRRSSTALAALAAAALLSTAACGTPPTRVDRERAGPDDTQPPPPPLPKPPPRSHGGKLVCQGIDFWTRTPGPLQVPVWLLSQDERAALANLRVRLHGRVVSVGVYEEKGKKPVVIVYAPPTDSPYSREIHFIADCHPTQRSPRVALRPAPAGAGRPVTPLVIQRYAVRERSEWVRTHRSDPGKDTPGLDWRRFVDSWGSKKIRGGQSLSFPIPGSERAGVPLRMDVTIWGASVGEHLAKVYLDGRHVRTVKVKDEGVGRETFDLPPGTPPRAGRHVVKVGLDADDAKPADSIYFSEAGIYARDPVRFDGAPLLLRSYEKGTVDVELPPYAGPLWVWDVSTPPAPLAVKLTRTRTGATVLPGYTPAHAYLLFDPRRAPAPRHCGRDARPGPRDYPYCGAMPPAGRLSREGDLIVIAPAAFHAALKPLLDRRRSQGYRPVLFTPREVFRLFGGGHPSPKAVHALVEHALSAWRSVRAMLIVADAAPEVHVLTDLEAEITLPTNFVMGYHYSWISSDLAYAFGPSGTLPRLAVGRIPARTAAEVKYTVQRILQYESSTRHAFIYMSDDDEGGEDKVTANEVRKILDRRFTSTALHLLDFDRYNKPGVPAPLFMEPAAIAIRRAFTQALTRGAKVVQYFGHGDFQIVAAEGILAKRADYDNVAQVLVHGSSPPIFITYNCWTGYFAMPKNTITLGEYMLTIPRANVGVSALISPSDSIFVLKDLATLLQWELTVYRPRGTIGDAFMRTMTVFLSTQPAVLRWQAYAYNLLGDPTMPSPGSLRR